MTEKEMINIRNLKCDIDSVGEWNGNEQTVVDNINSVRAAVYDALPDDSDQEYFNTILSDVWDYFGSGDFDIDTTDITKKQIETFISKFIR